MGDIRLVDEHTARLKETNERLLREIAERKKVEEALRESEERYRHIFEGSRAIKWIVDPHSGIIVDANPAACNFYGYSKEELIGKKVSDINLLLKDELKQVAADVLSQKCLSFQFPHRLASGEVRDVEVYPTPMRIGGKDRIYSIIHDITDRKRIEEELKKREWQLAQTQRMAHIGSWELDVVSNEVVRSHESGSIFALTSDRTGLDSYEQFLSRVHPDDVESVEHVAMEVLAGKESFSLDFRIVRPNGSLRVIHAEGKPVCNERGEVVKIVGFDQDVTEQRQAEDVLKKAHDELERRVERRTAELKASNEQLRLEVEERKHFEEERARLAAAIEQTGEGVVIIDCEGTVQYINPAFERMSGYARHELVGRNISLLRSFKHSPEFYDSLWGTLRRGEAWTGRFIKRKKDGALFEAEITISPVRDDRGTIINYVAVERDVTQESLLEKQLRQAQKMEAIGTLAGGMAHDFKNLLIPVMLNTELVLCDPGLSASHRESLERALKSCRHASGIIKQVLTFSRRGQEERKPLHMGLLVSETLKLLQAMLPKNIEVKKSLSVSPGFDTVFVDGTQIQQVIMNLCNNAAHAMRENGGRLELALTNLFLYSGCSQRLMLGLASGPYVKLIVRDTGQGMDGATAEKIFDPFFTTKAPGEGTGLGLSVAYGILKKHGGAISVSSEPGEGATFEVFLPVIQADDQEQSYAPVKEESAPLCGGTERILFVDDEKAVCESVERILAYLGYQVTIAVGSVQALQFFREDPNRFDLAIIDFIMPGLTGIELSRAFKQIRPHIPVILHTAFHNISPQEAKEAGIREIVLKPILMAEIAEAIRRAIGN